MRSLGSTLDAVTGAFTRREALDTDTPGAHHAEIHRRGGKIAA